MKFDFGKNRTVDKIDAVPEDFRGLYAEGDDGKFNLRSDDPGVSSAVAAIIRLNGALTNARKEASEKKGPDLSPLAEYGEDPAEIAAKISEKIQSLETQLESSKGKKGEEIERRIEKLKNDLMAAHKVEIEKRDTTLNGLRTQLHSVLVSDNATREIVAASGDPDLVMPIIGPSLKAFEVDGKFVVRVVDENGDPRISGVTGEAMSIKERVSELKGHEKFGVLFKSDAPNGGGANPNPRRAPVRAGEKPMSSVQKISAGLQSGSVRAGAADKRGSGVY